MPDECCQRSQLVETTSVRPWVQPERRYTHVAIRRQHTFAAACREPRASSKVKAYRYTVALYTKRGSRQEGHAVTRWDRAYDRRRLDKDIGYSSTSALHQTAWDGVLLSTYFCSCLEDWF